MSNSYIQPKADAFAQLNWMITQKYRNLVMAILLIVIFLLSFYVYYRFVSIEKDLQRLQAYEPVFVLKASRDLNVGDAITVNDLSIAKVFREEYERFQIPIKDQKINQSSLFACRNDSSLSSCKNLLGRVLKVPIYKGSILREELLAQEGVEPGIVNLLAKDEAFVDINVPQTGFNVYLKPDDLVDVYNIDNNKSSIIAKKARIVMIDAQALGKAPMQVKVDPNLKRSLTLAIQKNDLHAVTNSVKNKKTYVTLHNLKDQEKIIASHNIPTQKKQNLFQSLTLIRGNEKEIIKQ